MHSLCVLKLILTENEVPLDYENRRKNLESLEKVCYYRKEHSVVWDKHYYFSSDPSLGLFSFLQAVSNPVEKFSQCFLVNENISIFIVLCQNVICFADEVTWWVQIYFVLIEFSFNLLVFCRNLQESKNGGLMRFLGAGSQFSSWKFCWTSEIGSMIT